MNDYLAALALLVSLLTLTPPLLAGSSALGQTLPRLLRPARPYDVTHYQLTLRLNAATGAFRTTTRVRFLVHRSMSVLELDAVGQKIAGARLLSQGAHPLPLPIAVQTDKTDELQGSLAITLPMRLSPGTEAEVEIDAAATAEREPRGLFALRGAGRPLYLTRLLPMGARRVFPCHDDPQDRASLELIVETQRGLDVLGVGQRVQAGPLPGAPGLQRVVYSQAQPLPTHMYFVAIGGLGRPGRAGDSPAAAPPGAPPAVELLFPDGRAPVGAERSQRDAQEALTAIQRFLGVPYPFAGFWQVETPTGALDPDGARAATAAMVSVAPPGGFGPLTAESHLQQLRSAGVVAEALATQWFGGLVTAHWWEDWWLFAALSRYATNRYLAELYGRDAVAVAQWAARGQILARDARLYGDSPPLRRGELESVDAALDPYAVLKGEQLVGMIAQTLGEERLRAGLSSFLSTRAWTSASVDEFLEVLQRVQEAPPPPPAPIERPSSRRREVMHRGAGLAIEIPAGVGNAGAPPAPGTALPVGVFAKSWLETRGFPILTVRAQYDRVHRQTLLTLRQRPSLSADPALWHINLPVGLHRAGALGFHVYASVALDAEQATVAIPTPAEPDWIAWNRGGVVLCSIEEPETPEAALIRRAHLDPDPVSRLDGLSALAQRAVGSQPAAVTGDPPVALAQLSPAALQALYDAIRADPSPHVRYHLMRQLASLPGSLPELFHPGTIEMAHGPAGLDPQDPLAITLGRAGALELVGRIPGDASRELLAAVVQDGSLSVDLIEAAALGLARRGDERAVQALIQGAQAQRARGPAYQGVVLSAYGALSNPTYMGEIVRAIRAAAQGGQWAIVDRALGHLLRNQDLRKSPDLPDTIAALVLRGGLLNEDQQVQALDALSGLSQRQTRAVLESVRQRARTARIRTLARLLLQRNFG